MTHLKISVIIPVYNVQDLVEETVNSVLNQTLPPDEIILINDGSKDSSWNVLQKLASKHDKIKIFNQQNAGPSVTRNRGVDFAENEWICFVDADDLLHPQRLEVAAAFTKNVDAVICEMKVFEEITDIDNNIINIREVKNLPLQSTYISIIKNGYGLPSTLIKKSAFQDAGGIDPNLVNNEDFEFHFRMITKRFKLTKLEISLYHYRQHHSDTRVSKQKNIIFHIHNAQEKMISQIDLLPNDLQELSKKTLGNRMANNALKQALIGDRSYKGYLLKAKQLNSNLRPYKNKYHNMLSAFFGYGNIEILASKILKLKS
jgi:glycosyltransferase involved in cell wall biosynthesis